MKKYGTVSGNFDAAGGRPIIVRGTPEVIPPRSSGENDLAHQARLSFRDHLSNEPAEREAQQINLSKVESAYEGDGILSHLLNGFGR